MVDCHATVVQYYVPACRGHGNSNIHIYIHLHPQMSNQGEEERKSSGHITQHHCGLLFATRTCRSSVQGKGKRRRWVEGRGNSRCHNRLVSYRQQQLPYVTYNNKQTTTKKNNRGKDNIFVMCGSIGTNWNVNVT